MKPTSWVYFIQEGSDGPIKIGYTAGDPMGRLAALQTGNSKQLCLLAKCSGTQEDERRYHERFSHLRISGEWFLLGEELLEVISQASKSCSDTREESEGRTRLDCGLDRSALQDIADYIEAQRLHKAACEVVRATERLQQPPLSLAERLEALADELRSMYCGGGAGVELFGPDLIRERGHELQALAQKIRDGHARQEAN